jgi:hypothetical protein
MEKVKTDWWICNPTTCGRCGISNCCGIDIKKYVMRLRGNLASGNSRGGPIVQT